MKKKTSNSSGQQKEAMSYDMLRLDHQLCFSLYVCSKEIIRLYKPLLDPHELTYTGYIVLLALWEEDQITIKELGKKLYLDSGTLTPLLKKLETGGYLLRSRSAKDERNVYISLTDKGRQFRQEAMHFPEKMVCTLDLAPENIENLLSGLHEMMLRLNKTYEAE